MKYLCVVHTYRVGPHIQYFCWGVFRMSWYVCTGYIVITVTVLQIPLQNPSFSVVSSRYIILSM